MRHDSAAYEADADYAQHHWFADRRYLSPEAEEWRRDAREEGHGTAYDPTAPREELTGGLWDQLNAAIAAARRSGQ